MYFIEHIGYGPLTNEGEVFALTFEFEQDAKDYLANCGELKNLGNEWEVRRV